MIEIPFLLTEILFAGIWILIRAAVWIARGRIDWKREALLLLMYVNLAVIIRFVFFPMDRVDGRVQPLVFDASALRSPRINLIPLVMFMDYDSPRELLLNNIGNVAMFIPTGIILPILYRKLDSFWKVAAAGAGISLCIEILQLPFSIRVTDIDDLWMNTAGVMIGYGIYALARAGKSRRE